MNVGVRAASSDGARPAAGNGARPAEGELERLALAAREGSAAQFDELVRRIRPRLVAFAGRVLSDRGLAEEAAQETLVRLYRFLPQYRSGNFTGWCFAIAHNACLDVARRERRAARAHAIEPDGRPDPIEAVDVRRAVEEALDRLPRKLRMTFLLLQQGLAYADVARVLRCPVGTVRSRVHEARRRLREMLVHVVRPGVES